MRRNPYKFRGPHTWALVKEAYLAGETARSICDRLDVGLSAMRRRMKLEGWTRRDHATAIDAVRVRRMPLKPEPLAPPEPEAPPPAPAPVVELAEAADPSAAEVARLAVRESARALAAGDYVRAERVLRTAESMARLVAALPALDPDGAVTRAPKDAPKPFTPSRDIWALLAERMNIPTAEEELAARGAYLSLGMSQDEAEEAVWNQYADRYRAAGVRHPSERRADPR